VGAPGGDESKEALMPARDNATRTWSLFGLNCLLDTPDARIRLAAATTMAARLAHELNQPLAAAANYLHASARLLRVRSEGFEDVLAMLEHASRETLKAGEIVRRTRRFILTGNVAGRRENLRAMVERVTTAVPAAGEPKVAIVGIVPADHFVLADHIQIEQVLSNLLRNALEALDGRPRRDVAIDSIALDEEIVLRIEDNGPGFSEEALAHAFEPQFTTKLGRLGLGLAISKLVVEAHGGRIWIENLKQGGAAVNVALPAAKAPERMSGRPGG
jgi:two-component system sensor kinase FixL